MEDKKQAIETVSDQINSVINNIADKIEGPAESVKEMAKYGFEKSVEYTWATAISTTILTLLILGACSYFYYKIFTYEYNDLDNKRTAIIGATIVGVIIAFICVLVLGHYFPNIICPEGPVIQEILYNLRNQ